MVVLVIAAVGVVAAVVLFRAAPRVAFFSWAAVLFFVPIWVGFSAGHFYSAVTLVTLVCVASASLRNVRLCAADAILALFAVLVGGAFLLGGVTLGHLLIAMVDWLLPYVFGRVVLARVRIGVVTSFISLMTVVAAGLALLEFATGVNLFVLIHWNNGGYELWSPLQSRGGFIRAEGAFGHSIALGACLSIGSVFILSSRWRLTLRIAAITLAAGAIVVTFSRIGLVGFILGIVLSVAFLGKVLSVRTRIVVAAIASAGALAVTPFLSEVFTAAGTEAQGSADYRLNLVSLLSKMVPLGLSPSYEVLPNGTVYVGDFHSIDSALILTGIRLGFVPLLILMAVLVLAVVKMFGRKANVPLIAVVSQIPTLATVDMITQFPYLLWFAAGLAVSLYVNNDGRASEPARAFSGQFEPLAERTFHD